MTSSLRKWWGTACPVVASPALEVFKAGLDWAWSNLVYWKVSLGLDKIFRPNPNNSVFLWSFAPIQLYLLKPALICNTSDSRKAPNKGWGTHLQSPLQTQLCIIPLFYRCGNRPVVRANWRSRTCHQLSEPKNLWVLTLCHNQKYHCLYSLNDPLIN